MGCMMSWQCACCMLVQDLVLYGEVSYLSASALAQFMFKTTLTRLEMLVRQAAHG